MIFLYSPVALLCFPGSRLYSIPTGILMGSRTISDWDFVRNPSENVSGVPPEFFRDSAGITYPSRDYVGFFTFTGIPVVTNWVKSLNPGSRLWHFGKKVLNWDFHKDREFAFRGYIGRWIYLCMKYMTL